VCVCGGGVLFGIVWCTYVCGGMVCLCVGRVFVLAVFVWCVCICFEKIDGVVCIVLGNSVARVFVLSFVE